MAPGHGDGGWGAGRGRPPCLPIPASAGSPQSPHPLRCMTTVGGAFLLCVEHRLESLCHREGVKKHRLESLCHREGVKKHRLESRCHQEGVKKDRLERLRLCRKPVVGLEIDSGAWALARFCAPWVPNTGEKEKNALPKERKAVGARRLGTARRDWPLAKTFFSFSPGNCLRWKKRAKAHAPRSALFQACSCMCHGWTPGWAFGCFKCHCGTPEMASAWFGIAWPAPFPTRPITGYREPYNPGLRSEGAGGKWGGDFVVRSMTGGGVAARFNRGGSWRLPRGQGGRRWAPL